MAATNGDGKGAVMCKSTDKRCIKIKPARRERRGGLYYADAVSTKASIDRRVWLHRRCERSRRHLATLSRDVSKTNTKTITTATATATPLCCTEERPVIMCTFSADVQFTEVHHAVDGKLHDHVSGRRLVNCGALEADRGTVGHVARILRTHRVVAPHRRRDHIRHVRHTDDEIARTPTCFKHTEPKLLRSTNTFRRQLNTLLF